MEEAVTIVCEQNQISIVGKSMSNRDKPFVEIQQKQFNSNKSNVSVLITSELKVALHIMILLSDQIKTIHLLLQEDLIITMERLETILFNIQI
jgi:hypothetical protein